MIKIIAKNFVKQGKVEQVLVLAKELVQETLKENGCISYGMYQSESDENVLTMIEQWENKDVLKAHMASEHFKRIVPLMNEFMDKKAEMDIYKKVI